MKIYYPTGLDRIFHLSKEGKVYQLDSFRKMIEIYERLSKDTTLPIEKVDLETVDPEILLRFHTPDFVESLLTGKDREKFIESCGVFWQPSLPIAMMNRAQAAILALESLAASQNNFSFVISDGGHHTVPSQAFGFGPINAAGIAINSFIKENKDIRIAILDLDVHQGNGFSFIENKQTQIYDIWNKKLNKWPVSKNPNYFSWQVENIDGYIHALQEVSDKIAANKPDIAIYYSGADVLSDDRMFGIPGFTLGIFKERESRIFSFLKKHDLKTMLSIGGGYVDYTDPAKVEANRKRLVDKHMITIETALEIFK